MQIVDVGVMGIRIVVITLKRHGSRLIFELYPMTYVAPAEFYETVRAQIDQCDMVVLGGVRDRSLRVRMLTETYRIIRFRRRSGLVTQNLTPTSFHIQVINADITGEQFDDGWRKVPRWQRLLIWALLPYFLVETLLMSRRRMLTLLGEIEDEPGAARVASAATFPEYDDLLNDFRDRQVIEALGDLHERHSAEPIKVAVVYGGSHIGAIAHGMSLKYGYKATDGRYVTLYDDYRPRSGSAAATPRPSGPRRR